MEFVEHNDCIELLVLESVNVERFSANFELPSFSGAELCCCCCFSCKKLSSSYCCMLLFAANLVVFEVFDVKDELEESNASEPPLVSFLRCGGLHLKGIACYLSHFHDAIRICLHRDVAQSSLLIIVFILLKKFGANFIYVLLINFVVSFKIIVK